MSKYNVYVEDVSVEAVFNKLGGVEGARRFLANELLLMERPRPNSSVPLDINAFFQTREGLWVSDSFCKLVVAKVSPGGDRVVAAKGQKLDRNMNDEKIEEMLGNGHVFDGDVLCHTLAKMIQNQWGGKSGQLLNNGYANLFYLSSCVVHVYWRAVDRRWYVDAWERGGHEWRAVNQVFSPATVT